MSDASRNEPVKSVRTPIALEYTFTAGLAQSRFLRGLLEKRIVGQRCRTCGKVYVPPRGSCPTDGVPTEDDVELAHKGTITTFCVVNVPFLGQKIDIPYVAANILIDGADIPFQHLIQECEAKDVRMGLRVEAVWRPREEWGTTLESIQHFRPTGEPDAPYEAIKDHL